MLYKNSLLLTDREIIYLSNLPSDLFFIFFQNSIPFLFYYICYIALRYIYYIIILLRMHLMSLQLFNL